MDKDPDCKGYDFKQLVEVFAEQLLDDDLEITDTEELEVAAECFINILKAIKSRTQVFYGATAEGLDQMQHLPNHIHNFISSVNSS